MGPRHDVSLALRAGYRTQEFLQPARGLAGGRRRHLQAPSAVGRRTRHGVASSVIESASRPVPPGFARHAEGAEFLGRRSLREAGRSAPDEVARLKGLAHGLRSVACGATGRSWRLTCRRPSSRALSGDASFRPRLAVVSAESKRRRGPSSTCRLLVRHSGSWRFGKTMTQAF